MGKNKKKSKARPSGQADALQSKQSKPQTKVINPFEVHTNKEKFTILGRKLKHDKGMPGVSRAKATQKRKETLAQEYLKKDKTNRFTDKRVGRHNMSREDAADARFVAERLNQFNSKRHALYNLNDDELLTHKGQTLGQIEQYHDTISDDDDDEELGKLDAEFTGAAHFGGDDGQEGRNRKSAIDELIAETKRRKVEVSKEKEEVSALTQKLDDNWRSLLSVMDLTKEDDESKPKPDDFDRALKEMVFEPRGTVTDKLDNEEKLLKKEKSRLERLEKERLDRMHGLTEEEKKPKHRSADDLDDGYFVEPVGRYDKNNEALAYDGEGKSNRNDDDSDEELERLIKENTIANGKAGEEASESESSEDEEDEQSGSGEDSSAEEDHFSDLVCNSDSDAEKASATAAKQAKQNKVAEKVANGTAKQCTEEQRQAMMEKAAKELPYTFELPDRFETLEKVLKNRNAEFQAVILDRMIKCNHPKVEPTNKEKMITLFAYLLQHINDTAAQATTANVQNFFRIVDRLCPLLYDLSHLNAAETTQCFLEVIKEKQIEYRGNEKDYPALDTLIFFKLAADLYSVSDFRHSVVSPSVIFISHILSRSRVNSRVDIASGLFLVTTIQQYTQLSKRFLPSAINFLAGVIYLCIPKRPIQNLKVIPPFKSTGDQNSLLVLSDKEKGQLKSVTHGCMEAVDLMRPEIDAAFKVRALNTALQLTADFLQSSQENMGARFLALPIESALQRLDAAVYPKFVQDTAQKCRNQINAINDKNLSYIVPAVKKPKQLKLLEPKIERIYDDKRNRKPGQKEKGVRDGMLQKIKRETKGAVREIRRDNAFIQKMKHRQQMQSDSERRDKVRRIFSEASIQQGELNALDRKKKHM